ncbi:MAG: SLC13 family permease [Terriglobales bacterium]
MHLLASLTVPSLAEWRVIAGCLIFAASYLVFAIGRLPGFKIDRPGMAIIGAVAMVATRVVRPGDALRFVDFGTIVLLFCMMLLVGFLHTAGLFDWITSVVARHLPPSKLLPAVIFTTGLLSAFFVNDIICLVMVPFVLSTTRQMRLPPLPYLLAIATASNIGGVATITGNPQNMLIGSVSRISYRDFLVHLGPVAILGLLLDWLVLHFFVSRSLFPLAEPVKELQEVSQAEGPQNGKPETGNRKRALRKPVIVMACVLAGFLAGVAPATMAAIGAAAMLITRSRNPQQVYDEVNWDLLVFFVGLFVIVGGAENAGVTDGLLAFAQRWNLNHTAVFTVATALISNVVSNVPAVMLLKSLVPSFPNAHDGWLLLAMASTLAGNLTISGSVANLIVVERARGEVYISFTDYLKVGLPITLLTLAVGWAWLTFLA